MKRRDAVLLTLLGVLIITGFSAPAKARAQVIDVHPRWEDKSDELPGMTSGKSVLIAAGVVVAGVVLWKVLSSDGNEADSGNGSAQLSTAPRPMATAAGDRGGPVRATGAGGTAIRWSVPANLLAGTGASYARRQTDPTSLRLLLQR